MERIVTLFLIILSLKLNDVNSSPMWMLVDENEPKLPSELDFTNIFESKLDKINRYRHLQDLLQSAIVTIDKYEERVFDEIIALEEELPFLREIRAASLPDPATYLQPRTFVNPHKERNNNKPDFIPLRKRKNQLSVDLTLHTLKDMLASEEGKKRKENNMDYSASRLLRAGKK